MNGASLHAVNALDAKVAWRERGSSGRAPIRDLFDKFAHITSLAMAVDRRIAMRTFFRRFLA